MHYYNKLKLLALASVLSVASARPSTIDIRGNPDPEACVNGKAIYVASNAASNAVVAVPIAENGSLQVAKGSSTATGGAGANGLEDGGKPSGPDAIFSQSGVAIAGDYLFAVNAGSNTVTMLAIDKHNPAKLTVVGKSASLPGEFPTTVAASDKYKLVCVGLTGAKAGVACAPYSPSGIGAVDALRPFNLGQTTPPAGPLNTVSQVFFSDDETTLYVTVKGDPTVGNTGFLAAFPVQNTRSSCHAAASVAAAGVTSSPSGTAVLFGSATIKGSSNLFVTDASFGAAVLSVDASGKAATVGKGVIAGQAATCWVAISPATKTAFVTDAGLDRLVEMSLTDASIIGSPIDLSASNGGVDPGLTDLRAAGSFVYALSPGNGTTDAAITVFNALTKQAVDHVSVASLGLTKNAEGMAILV
ncbi:hypothetical protein SPBR_04268 [Sporothrix brasiliensis 5110]|uniref:3-carboxymuconate cyclase n=1 Tax=Sporothrix brasiliensis 5110 TaxID=1398154 RepID=A0A0C2F3U8_9PEZI|nr:uncharacterized protein SPBR_04268 [Sporothrix brasiliensis 5110]KIH93594.1 hypothetical protein SPBR_04268 [Sporothrix brasiliensis 5110]